MSKRVMIRTRAVALVLAIWVMAACPSSVVAALQNENLLAPLPSGFKIGFATERGRMTMSEFVPTSDTVDAWSSMITVQIFHGMANADPDAFANALASRWKSACAGGDAQKIRSGMENGYPVSLWMFACPLNPGTKQPENMWLKVISGSDSLYSVQYGYRRALDKDLIGPAMDYLRQVAVCDTRRADRPCPRGM
jgi:hypothetical protein